MNQHRIESKDVLRARYGEPAPIARDKVLDALDRHCRAFIGLSPFLVLATADADGRVDASPRGDGPGFVAVLDDRTLLIPDRMGNRRTDSFSNVLSSPGVGLIFLVPGVKETLRVNGRAEITTDPALLEPLSVRERTPLAGLLVHVEEAFLHCSKALVRADLWNADKQVDRKVLPPLGEMMAEQIEGLDAEAAEHQVQESIRTRLY